MKIKQLFALSVALLMAFPAFADNYPIVSPTVEYTDSTGVLIIKHNIARSFLRVNSYFHIFSNNLLINTCLDHLVLNLANLPTTCQIKQLLANRLLNSRKSCQI